MSTVISAWMLCRKKLSRRAQALGGVVEWKHPSSISAQNFFFHTPANNLDK